MGTSNKLKQDRPLVGISLGGSWAGDIDAALSQYSTAWNTGGVSGHVVECYTHYFYPGLTNWSNGTALTYPYSQINGFTGQVIWSMQAFPSGGSYSQLLGGAYKSAIQTLGNALAVNTPDAVVRYGWEADGNWFPWGLGAGNTVSQLQDAWGYTIPLLRAEGWTGPAEFNMVNENGYDPLVCAPDPSLYDLVGLDKYGGHGDMTKSSDWPYCWTTFQKPVYDRAADLAARDGKRISISECSTGIRYGDYTWVNGSKVYQPAPGWMCGDDDYFLIQLAEWIRQHNVAIWSNFEGNDTYGQTTTDYYGTHAATDIKNRFAWLTAATTNQAGPFSSNMTNFPNSIAWWKGSGSLPENLVQENSHVSPPPATGNATPARRGRINTASRWDMSWYG